MNLKICKLHPDAIVPKYQTEGAACFDIHAIDCVQTPIFPGRSELFSTGLAFEVPEDHVLMVYSRSGHGFKNGVRLANCVGVIDSDYRGELMVRLTHDASHGPALSVAPGDRIAQAMLIKVPRVSFEVVEQLSITERGVNGLGSTGAK